MSYGREMFVAEHERILDALVGGDISPDMAYSELVALGFDGDEARQDINAITHTDPGKEFDDE